jgi:hypothetical protein
VARIGPDQPLPSGVSAAQLLAAAAVAGNGTYVAMSILTGTGIDPTGVADSTAAIQAKIDAVPSGKALFIPAGTYKISDNIVISKHINIVGESSMENFRSITAGGGLNPGPAPFLTGVVFEQQTAAKHGLALTGSGIVVNIQNVGLTWAAAIRSTNTGDGIYAVPTQTYLSGHDSGVQDIRLTNVNVYGHDGNHYAFRFLNAMQGMIQSCRSHGGGGYWIECDSYAGNYGNLVFVDTYVDLFNAGTAHGYATASRTLRAATGMLNLCEFIRPQCNLTAAAATAGTQKAWYAGAGAVLPPYIEVWAPDLEIDPGSTCEIDFGGKNSGTIVNLGGGLLTKDPLGGYTGTHGYMKFTATGSFRVPKGVTEVRSRVIAGGGGGGGGGSASAVTNQAGGGGGGAGLVADGVQAVVSDGLYTVTVGLGGTAGVGGVAGGAVGTAGGLGGTSTFNSISATGGGGGLGGPNNTNGGQAGGLYGRNSSITTVSIPGCGGPSQVPNGNAATPMSPGVSGGGGGGGATATLGGGGGGAATVFPTSGGPAGGSSGVSATATGVAGTTATGPGSGGGGGGGGAPTGAGGNGGAGAPGQVEIWW